MIDYNEQKYWLFPVAVEGLGSVSINKFLAHFGTVEAIYKAPENELKKVAGISPLIIDNILNKRKSFNPDSEYERIKKLGINFVNRTQAAYPKRLLEIPDPPDVLFYLGKLPSSDSPALAIIGSRTCSTYGSEIALHFSQELASCGIDIISGMAAGVDGYSHRGAIKAGGETFAVLGCGVDICYPKKNRDIYDSITENGGILSEFYPSTLPIAANFPRRNRIISGLSDAILVVEARQKSGTLITVNMGLEQGKDIFAIPGRINDNLSLGCNGLIHEGAVLVQSPLDIIRELSLRYGYIINSPGLVDYSLNCELSPKEKMLLSQLDQTPESAEMLSAALNLDITEILSLLTMLEIKGAIEPVGPGKYIRCMFSHTL